MAVHINPEWEVSKVEGVATLKATNENLYVEAAKEAGLDKKVLKEVEDFNGEYIEEYSKVAAAKAKELMSEDKDIEKVLLDAPYTTSKRGSVNVTVARSQTFKSPKDGSEVTKSTVRVAVTAPVHKVSKTKIKEIEADLTAALLG